MKAKKESQLMPILFFCGLLFVIYVAIQGAIAYAQVEEMIAAGEMEGGNQLISCLTLLMDRLSAATLEIRFNQYTLKWVFWGVFAWVIVILMIQGDKKNFIHGKEFGDAKWGTIADIKDLFASNIAQAEIKKAKKVRNPIGRWVVKRDVYKECERDGQALLKLKLEQAKEAEKERKKNGTADQALYKDEVKKIREEVKRNVELAKQEAWKPDQYAADYEAKIKDIELNTGLSQQEKEAEKRKAKKEYDEKLSEFYSGKKKIEKIKKKYANADMLLTATERISFYNYKLNQNTLIIGGSGSGKTRGYVMPNVLQAHSSYVITDPKGEILEKAGYFLSEVEGYKIRVLNLDEKSLSDGYNPFEYIHPERPGYEERVLSLIETIIVNTDGGEKKGSSDPFWDKAERLFLQAIFFFTTDGFAPEQRNMTTVMQLIGMLEIGEEEDNRDSDLDFFAEIFAENHGQNHIGVEQYKEFRSKASGKTAKSIVISAVARLAPFRTKEVRRIFSYDSMKLDRVGEEKTAVFVVVPPTDTSFNFIAGMLFTQLFQELQYCATQVHKHEGQRLPIPVRFILDEFANTCTIPQFVKILAYARSFGIGIVPILQSLEQIKNMYKDEWGVIIDNCNSLLYLGSVSHMDTLEYISKLLGKGTYDKKTTGRTRGKQGSSSTNYDVVGRELMFADDVRRLPKEDCLLIIGGRNPFYSKKYLYEKHPNYRYTSDANHAYSYVFKPAPPPEIKVVKEEAYVEPQVNNPVKGQELDDYLRVDVPYIELTTDQMEELRLLTEGYGRLAPLPDSLV